MKLSALLTEAFARLNPATRTRYQHVWTGFALEAKIIDLPALKALNGRGLEKVLDVMLTKYAPATVALTLAAVRCVVRKGVQLDALPKDSTVGVKVPVGDNVPRNNVLLAGELEKLAKALPLGTLERAVVLALALQGLRRAELCAATWGDVKKGSDGRLELHLVGKGGKPAVLGLQPLVLKAVQAWAGTETCGAPNAPFIAATPGVPLDEQQVYRMVNQITLKHLGHRATPHGLRATFGSDVIARKGIEVARQLMRHSSINTTVRYSRWLATRDDDRTL